MTNETNPLNPSQTHDFPVPDFPDHLTMFFCIGAQKAGSTWLHDYLSKSDQVHFSRNKELHYFDVLASRAGLAMRLRIDALRILSERLNPRALRLNREVVDQLVNAARLLTIYTGKGDGADRHDPYLAYLLDGLQDQTVVGDITPAYSILDRQHFADMATIGRAKFVFMMRDPVARMWSQIRMAASAEAGRDQTPERVAAACIARARKFIDEDLLARVTRADYLRTMAELEAAVPQDRILYVFYEDIFAGNATQEICAFLGIRHLPPEATKRVNEGASVPLPDDIRDIFRASFAAQYDGVRARFGERVPASWLS